MKTLKELATALKTRADKTDDRSLKADLIDAAHALVVLEVVTQEKDVSLSYVREQRRKLVLFEMIEAARKAKR